MGAIFIKILNMSIAASWLVVVVVLLRVIFRKMPKMFRCILWVLVGIRLICPWFMESHVSLLPSADTVPQDIMEMEEPKITTGMDYINSAVNPIIKEHFSAGVEPGDVLNIDVANEATSIEDIVNILSMVWLVGMAVMFLYYIVSYISIRSKVKVSINVIENVYLCDNIVSAFILGIIKPRIYVPSYLTEEERECVVAHEKAHLKRLDNIWKPLGFAMLTVYWFNPVLWVAYILLCRDIELACDERVIRELGIDEVKTYSKTLLSCGVSRRVIAAAPLAFGEVAVKTRVKSALNYKKPTFWIIAVAVVISIVVGVGFLTNPIKGEKGNKQEGTTHKSGIYEEVETTAGDNDIHISNAEDKITYYSLDNFYCIELSEDNNTCYFFTPMASMSGYSGTYVLTNVGLTLTFDLGELGVATREFRREGDKLIYNITASKKTEFVNMSLEDEDIFIISGSEIVQDEIDKLIGEGIMGNKEHYVVFAPEEIISQNDAIYMGPTIRLDQLDKTFTYTSSALSSYIMCGEYEYAEDKLVLKAGDTYVFIRQGDEFVYSNELSSISNVPYGEAGTHKQIIGSVYIMQDWY